jgi:3-dehydrosphinganine reductase
MFMADLIGSQTVLLTGASEGMGRSVAKQLAAKGANVVIVSRNVGKLEEALAEVKVSINSRCSTSNADTNL